MRTLIAIVLVCLSFCSFACSECGSTGKKSYFVPCEYCKGKGTVDPGSIGGLKLDYREITYNCSTGARWESFRYSRSKSVTIAAKCTKCSAAKSGFVRQTFPCWKCSNGPKLPDVGTTGMVGKRETPAQKAKRLALVQEFRKALKEWKRKKI